MPSPWREKRAHSLHPDRPAPARLFFAYSTKSRHMAIDVAGSDSGGPTDSDASIRVMTETEFASRKHGVARSFAAGSSGEEPPPPRALDDADEAFAYDVQVSEEHRSKGYGRMMMAEAPRRAAALGLGRVRLQVFEENLPAIGLYRKLGYRTTVEFRFKDL